RARLSSAALPGTSAGRRWVYSTIFCVSSGDIWAPVMLCPSLAALVIVIVSSGEFADQFGTRHPVIAGGSDLRCDPFGVELLAVLLPQGTLLLPRYIVGAGSTQVGFFGQHLAHEVALALELHHVRQRAGEDLGGVAALDLLEQIAGKIQMPQLVVEEALPQRLDARVILLLGAAVVHVDLHGLVHQPLLHQTFRG